MRQKIYMHFVHAKKRKKKKRKKKMVVCDIADLFNKKLMPFI